jgi:hypothetical protein
MPCCPLTIDRVVDFFAGEDKFWNHTATDPDTWKQKQRDHYAAQERHYKEWQTLKHYVECGQDTKRNSTRFYFSGDLFNVDDDGDIIDLVGNSTTNTISNAGSVDGDMLLPHLCHPNPTNDDVILPSLKSNCVPSARITNSTAIACCVCAKHAVVLQQTSVH